MRVTTYSINKVISALVSWRGYRVKHKLSVSLLDACVALLKDCRYEVGSKETNLIIDQDLKDKLNMSELELESYRNYALINNCAYCKKCGSVHSLKGRC